MKASLNGEKLTGKSTYSSFTWFNPIEEFAGSGEIAIPLKNQLLDVTVDGAHLAEFLRLSNLIDTNLFIFVST